jgi:hypothetical protein
MDDGLEAELRGAEVRDGALYLDYAVHNRSPHRALLTNRLCRRTPHGPRVDRDVVYTELASGPTLIARKQFVDGEAPEPPFLTPVAPGRRFEETVALPLPVPPRHPYAPQPEAAPHEVGAVAFALGYVLEDEPAPLTISGAELRAEPGLLRARQRVRMLGPLSARVLTTIAG